jgi:hypothetical protein
MCFLKKQQNDAVFFSRHADKAWHTMKVMAHCAKFVFRLEADAG